MTARRGPDPLKVVFVVLVVLIIVVSMFLVFSHDRGGDNGRGEPQLLSLFSTGSSELLMNPTFFGQDGYIRVPSDADIERATVKIAGIMPPDKIIFEGGKAPSDVASADVDLDTFMDVLVLNYLDNNMMVFENMAGTRLRRIQTVDVGEAPVRVETADLDGDGYPDAAVLSEDSKDIRVLMNDGYGRYVQKQDPLPSGMIPTDLHMMDIEGDGDVDIMCTSLDEDALFTFRNDGSGGFQRWENIATEGNPQAVRSTDIDGDGLLDLIITNSADSDQEIYNRDKLRWDRWYNTVSILHNNGGYNFTKHVEDLKSQKGAYSLATADLNLDNETDIVMANWGYNLVTVILSNGRGDFLRGGDTELDCREYSSYDPIDISVQDLDGDGTEDVIALTKSADSVMVYMGDGKGNLGDYRMYYTGLSPTSMEMTDFDGDGDKDVITSDWNTKTQVPGNNGSVSVLLNLNGGVFGTYTQFRTGNSPRGIFAKDVDGDGDPDVATANYFGSTISVLINDGVGNFRPQKEYSIGLEPYSVIMEDFDRDGYMDSASADEANFRIVVLESDKKGGFTTDRYYYDIGGYPFSLRAKDIDGDGWVDLYTSNYFQNSTTIMFNDGSGDFSTMFNEFETVYLGDRMPYDALMEDLDSDGLVDLVTVNRGDDLDPTDTVSVLLNDGTYEFRNAVDFKVGKEPTSATVVDLNGDGHPDIATSNAKANSITVLLNDGNGSFTRAGDHEAGEKPLYITHMDHNEDGKPDLVVSNSLSNDLMFYTNTGGGSFQLALTLNIASGPFMIDTADFNGDGREDITLTSVNTGYAVLLGCYGYPSDVRLDLGKDGDFELSHQGPLTGEIEIDITDELDRWLRDHGGEGDVLVPIGVSASKEGMVRLYDLDVIYRLE